MAKPKPPAKERRGGTFKPGQSGNPGGRPKGTRNAATVAMEALLDCFESGGMIARRTGNPHDTDPWEWACASTRAAIRANIPTGHLRASTKPASVGTFFETPNASRFRRLAYLTATTRLVATFTGSISMRRKERAADEIQGGSPLCGSRGRYAQAS